MPMLLLHEGMRRVYMSLGLSCTVFYRAMLC